jgi:hypothetical protein
MAQLTDRLGSANSGRPIINPGPADPSVVGALADAASASIPGLVNYGVDRDRRRTEEAANRKLGIEDELARGFFDIRSGPGTVETPPTPREFVASGPPPIDGELAGSGLPSDVITATDDAVRAQRAARQGRLPAARYDLQLEAYVSEMMRLHPDMSAEIMAYAQSQGLDHYMFRSFQAEKLYADAGRDAQIRASTIQYDYAASRGLVTSNITFEQGARIGRQAMAIAQKIETIKLEREANWRERELTISERKYEDERLSRQMSSALIAQTAVALDPLIDSVSLAVAGAGTDAERQTVLGGVRIEAKAALISYRSQGVAELASVGASPEEIKFFTDYVDGQIESLDSLFSTSFNQNTASLRNLEASLGITSAEAMPIYHRISTLLGPAGANALITDAITGLPGLDPAMTEAARNEIRNFDPTSERGTMNLARAIGYLRGIEGLEDLTAEQAAGFLRANERLLRANQRDALGGNTGAVRHWMANYGNVAEAILELGPTTTSVDAIVNATGQLASRDARRTLELAFKEDPEFARALAQGSRGAAAKALMIARDQRVPNTPYFVAYNETAGEFYPQISRQSYDAWAATQRTNVRPFDRSLEYDPNSGNRVVPSYEQMKESGRIPEAVWGQSRAMNELVTHLVETDQYDEAIPGTLSRRERRDLYAAGRTPDSMRTQPGAPTQDSEWGQLLGNVNTQIETLLVGSTGTPLTANQAPPPRDQLQTRVRTEAEALGLSWGLVERVVRRESNWDPNATNRTTNARGLFQINDDNAGRTLDESISDGLNMLKDAQETAQRTLGRTPQDWEVYVVHQQGAGGGPALLNPANRDKNAVDVLAPLYPNRRIARQAVTANGGNVNMTAGEFLQSIRSFYER